MPATITLYSFEDADGEEAGCYTTQNYEEAKAYARQYGCRVVANEYAWSEAILLDDFTEKTDVRRKPLLARL